MLGDASHRGIEALIAPDQELIRCLATSARFQQVDVSVEPRGESMSTASSGKESMSIIEDM